MRIVYNAKTGTTVYEELTEEELSQTEMEQPEEVKPQPTLEERVTDIERVTAEVITILNDKGIAP